MCEKKISLHQQPCCVHDAVQVPPASPFHLGFMSFCTISIDYEHLQFSWGDFSAPHSPGFKIYTHRQQSTDPATVMRFILRPSAIATSTQETLSAPFSAPPTSPSFHPMARSSHAGLFWVQISSYTCSCPYHCTLGFKP